MQREIIFTEDAPQAIGTYSQAVKIGNTIYLSGQIPLIPKTMELIEGDMKKQITRVFINLAAVAKASGGTLSDISKLNIYLINLSLLYTINKSIYEVVRTKYGGGNGIRTYNSTWFIDLLMDTGQSSDYQNT